MRRRHLFAPLILAVAAVLATASATLAGGWAEIRPAAETEAGPPVAGDEAVIRFTVLQHGQTPVDWDEATVHLTDLSTGITTTTTATPEGSGGHYTASFTPTEPGFWTWRVTLRDLVTDPVSHSLAVHHPDGTAPALDPAALRTAVDQAAALVSTRTEQVVNDRMLTYADQFSDQRAAMADLRAELEAATAARDELASRLAVLEGGAALPAGGGLPVAVVILGAILAGGAAGFAMAALGRRSMVREIPVGSREVGVSPAPTPAPRGSTPA